MAKTLDIPIQAATEDIVRPYGTLLGKPFAGPASNAYGSPGSDFWSEHIFSPGQDGKTEILWVAYRNNDPVVTSLEAHLLTEQAVVPLDGEIVQVLALTGTDGLPDLSTLSAFRFGPGMGVCMNSRTWHATRSASATCLMLTRQSTTLDLVQHLVQGDKPVESAIQAISPIRLLLDEPGDKPL
ncbi:ureidoglycolate lyase [Rhizobium sp. CNPSo 4039]|uniref:ureidoglycolate lyase n=1 Tax=Rhizobium sp. CNPSo 4039 TaxID=3021409 RepID=UPI00254D5530|nr:ureidoglycolate lyase [Rhizobium sp. CNPSo 4039]MDK4716004.1 ureidoglycolate lyase [Rhizobium sp. CNPSo 4039]